MADDIQRHDFNGRLSQFEERLFAVPWIAERIMAGQQFNCYEVCRNGDDDTDIPDEDRSYSLCVGPITSTRFLCDIEGKDRAELIEAALKVATEAFRERIARAAGMVC